VAADVEAVEAAVHVVIVGDTMVDKDVPVVEGFVVVGDVVAVDGVGVGEGINGAAAFVGVVVVGDVVVVTVEAVEGAADVVTGEDIEGVKGVVGVAEAEIVGLAGLAGAVVHVLAVAAAGPKTVPATALVVWVPLAEPPEVLT
jgi:hypothetical protein